MKLCLDKDTSKVGIFAMFSPVKSVPIYAESQIYPADLTGGFSPQDLTFESGITSEVARSRV